MIPQLSTTLTLLGICFFFACAQPKSTKDKSEEQEQTTVPPKSLKDSFLDLFLENPSFLTDGFDYPVGKPNARGYYNAQPFSKNLHLGDDWNAVTGGNTDLGDPIYAIGNGWVKKAFDYQGGWGKVIWMVHCLDSSRQSPNFVISLYAHCDSMMVKKGNWVKKGEQIGTIGNADGIYLAHLHLEIRDSLELGLGGGYSPDQRGYLDPTVFIKANRTAR